MFQLEPICLLNAAIEAKHGCREVIIDVERIGQMCKQYEMIRVAGVTPEGRMSTCPGLEKQKKT